MSKFSSLLRNLFRRNTADRDLDDEVRSYAVLLEDENRASGIQPLEARREAHMALGGVEQVKEEVRGARAGAWLDSLWQDVKFSARILRKSPRFAAIAIATLAIGIGANTAIFSVVKAVLLRPLPYPNPDRIVTIDGAIPVDFVTQPSIHWVWKDWASRLQSLERFAAYDTGDVNFAITGNQAQRFAAAEVSPDFFQLFGIAPAAGRMFSAEEESAGHPLVAILGYSAATELGDPRDVVGKKIVLNGKQAVVVGVMPRGFEFPGKTRIWLPFAWSFNEEMLLKQALFFNSIGRLRPGVSAAQAQEELAAIADREAATAPPVPGRIQRDPIVVKPLHDQLVGSSRSALLILLGAVGFVLLIACADVANLLLARASHRQREIAMRAALGAGRMRLVRQGLTESLMLAFLGGASGFFLANWTLRGIQRLIPPRMFFVREVHLDASVFLFLLGTCLISGTVFGLFPVLHGLRVDLVESLKAGAGAGPTPASFLGRARGALAIAEIAMAMVLLSGAGLLIKSLWRLSSIDPGFRAENVMAAQISLPGDLYKSPAQRNAFFDATLQQINALPGIRDAAYVSDPPFGNIAGIMFRPNLEHETAAYQSANESQFASFFVVSAGYFQTLGIPLVAGREFSAADNASAPPVIIVSRALADLYWPGESPIGQRISLPFSPKPSPPWAEIVGIAGDTKRRRLDEEILPAYYVPLAQSPSSAVFLVTRISGDSGAAVRAIRAAVSSVDSALPFSDFLSMNDRVAASVAEPRFRTILLGAFAGIALVLAAAGIYGVMSYGVSQRTHEVGIRMALGAPRGSILQLILSQSLKLTAVGLAIGLAASWGLTRILTSVLYSVAPHDAATLIGVSLLLAVVAFAASYFPARRAMKTDPMIALRHE